MADPATPGFGVPARLFAGDSWAWIAHAPVVAGITVRVVLKPLDGASDPVPVPTAVEGRRRIARLAPAQTALAAPGVYAWVEILTRPEDGARWTGAEGRVEVSPDPAGSAGDMRSRAERILAAIDARIEGRITADCDAYTIEGRSITRTPVDVLMRVRGIYARQVAAECGHGGVRFSKVGFR